MVSVIIPVYNVKEYISRCMQSIIAQTCEELEIILVDDSSTDGSGECCDWWAEKDRRVKVLHLSENVGHGEARNAGVDICTGEYLTFLDSDDWWETDYTERMLAAAKKWDADLVLCDILYEYRGEKCCTEVSEIRMQSDKVYAARTQGNLINIARTFLWGKLYRTKFYKDAKIKQPPLGFDDLAVVPYLVSKAEKIVRCPFPLYHYLRYREGNTVDNFKNLYGITDALKILFEYFKTSDTYQHYYVYLRKLAFSQVRFAIRKIGMENKALYPDLISNLVNFMDEYFPEWFNPYNKNYAVVGNKNQAETVNLIMFDDKQLEIVTEDKIEKGETKYAYVFRNLPVNINSKSKMWDMADALFCELCEGN